MSIIFKLCTTNPHYEGNSGEMKQICHESQKRLLKQSEIQRNQKRETKVKIKNKQTYLLSLGSHHIEFVYFRLQSFVLDAQLLLRRCVAHLRQVFLHLPGREQSSPQNIHNGKAGAAFQTQYRLRKEGKKH